MGSNMTPIGTKGLKQLCLTTSTQTLFNKLLEEKIHESSTADDTGVVEILVKKLW